MLQPGNYDLVGTIIYEIDQNPYQSTFHNGTIEVSEPGGLLSVETVFLVSLGIALIGLSVFWIRGQIQNLSKVIAHTHHMVLVRPKYVASASEIVVWTIKYL